MTTKVLAGSSLMHYPKHGVQPTQQGYTSYLLIPVGYVGPAPLAVLIVIHHKQHLIDTACEQRGSAKGEV